MSEHKHLHEMAPISGEPVSTDGVYTNELGRQEKLERGEVFPADPQGTVEWGLTEFAFTNHHKGHTDPRLIPHDDDHDPEAHMQHPRRHKRKPHRGDE